MSLLVMTPTQKLKNRLSMFASQEIGLSLVFQIISDDFWKLYNLKNPGIQPSYDQFLYLEIRWPFLLIFVLIFKLLIFHKWLTHAGYIRVDLYTVIKMFKSVYLWFWTKKKS